jgi:hypothetical protein
LLGRDADGPCARGTDHHFAHVFFDRVGPGRLRECILRQTTPYQYDGGGRPFVEAEQQGSVDVTHEDSPVITPPSLWLCALYGVHGNDMTCELQPQNASMLRVRNSLAGMGQEFRLCSPKVQYES